MTNFLDFKPDSLSSLLISTMRRGVFIYVVHFAAIYHGKTEDGLNLST